MKEKKLLLGLMFITMAIVSAIKLTKLILTHEQSGVYQNIFLISGSLICAVVMFKRHKKENDASHE
jgi:hypothetical protein